jgi:CheY-like chemotaxis protein
MSRHPRILVADDDEPIRAVLLSRFLEGEGFTVDLAPSGRDALDHFAQDKYDLLLLDLNTSTVSGTEVARLLKQSQPELRRRVIVMIASAERDIQAVERASVCRILRKPFDQTELLTALRECIDDNAPADSTSSSH